ncbi:MAG: hypothetical protein KGL39_37960 [Patescibacteria group bacterium]|nr:hypothetical protein [Patescibacteria group bacterium]
MHRLHDEAEAIIAEAERTGKLASTALDLATVLRTGNVEDANAILDTVRARWFGPPEAAVKAGEEISDPKVQAFRNSSALFSYDMRMTEEEGFPSGEDIAEWLTEEDE